MYQMIGGDGNEYGPLSIEQLREYIAAGRANAQTKVKQEGETDWKTLADVPEAAGALAAKGAPPLPGTAPGPVMPALPFPAPGMDPDTLAADALARPYEVNIGLALGRAWDLLKSDFWPIIGVSALGLLLFLVATKLFVGVVVNGPLLGGLYCYYLKRIRGESGQINDLFSGFSQNFLQLFLGLLVSGLLITVGLILIIPAIYLGVAWQLTLPIIQDKRIGFWEAMEVSRKVLSRNWWGMFGLTLVIMLLNFAGALLCGIGMFVSLPLGLIALAYVYEDLFGNPKPSAAPALPEPGSPPAAVV